MDKVIRKQIYKTVMNSGMFYHYYKELSKEEKNKVDLLIKEYNMEV